MSFFIPQGPKIPGSSNFRDQNITLVQQATSQLGLNNSHILTSQDGNEAPLGPALTTLLFTTDVAGKIRFTSVSGTDQQCGYQFAVSYVVSPLVQLTPANAAAGLNAGNVYVQSNVNNFTICFAISDGGGVVYEYNYFVVESTG